MGEGRIISRGSLLRNAHEFPRSRPEKVCFYLRHKKTKEANLDQIFSESKSGTIAHKNQKRITAATHYELKFKKVLVGSFFGDAQTKR